MMSKRFLPFSSPAMALTLISVLVALLVLLDKTQAAPGPGDEAAVGSYLEYLQSLDRYGGGFQTRNRREDMASALMKLSQIRQHYSDLGRPRFGKRSGQYGEEY